MIAGPPAATTTPDSVLTLSGVWKGYGGEPVLKDVSMELRAGEVHMLLGENGAGKSTLVSLLIGAHAPDKGSVLVRGAVVEGYNPFEARQRGINVVLQDFSLAPSMTVAENYFLGREQTVRGFLRKRAMRAEAKRAIDSLGVALDIDRRVEDLSRPEQQLLEIIRAIGGAPGALILDEPTATLSHDETLMLFSVVRRLRDEGWAILYITHRLEEVRSIGDRITLLRDGRKVAEYAVGDVSDDTLIRDMVGRPLGRFYPTIASNPGKQALALVNVESARARIKDVSLNVRYGEIVGIGGLVGCGKGDIGNLIFGLVPIDAGFLEINGARRRISGPQDSLEAGIVYLPQDRRREALALNRSASENMTFELIRTTKGASLGFLRKPSLRAFVDRAAEELDLRPRNPAKLAQEFSGGNQQKLVLARAISRPRAVYIFCEPTSGIDVGARLEFYRQLEKFCAEGAAILLITSDMQELINLSHRIYVMHGGRISAELTADSRTEDEVARWSFGGTTDSARIQTREPRL